MRPVACALCAVVRSDAALLRVVARVDARSLRTGRVPGLNASQPAWPVTTPKGQCLSLFSPCSSHCFLSPSLSSSSPNPLWSRLRSSEMSSHLPHVTLLVALRITPYPLILNNGFLSTYEMPHVHMVPTWLSLLDLLTS